MRNLTLSITDATLTKLQLWSVAALFVSKDNHEKTVLKDTIDWAGTVVMAGLPSVHGPNITPALIADMLDGVTSDDPKFNTLLADLIVLLRSKPVPGPTPVPVPIPVVQPLASPNLLDGMNPSPWLDGQMGAVDPDFEPRLLAMMQNSSGRLLIADTEAIPDRMRRAGFDVRDTVCWHRLSRFYAGWEVGDDPSDGDSVFMAEHRDQVVQFWQNYLDIVTRAMRANPSWVATMIGNDGHDHCGRTLGNYSVGGLGEDVRDRVEMGETVQD